MERRKLSLLFRVCHLHRFFLFSFEVAVGGLRNEEIGPDFLRLKACRILGFQANPNELYSYAEKSFYPVKQTQPSLV